MPIASNQPLHGAAARRKSKSTKATTAKQRPSKKGKSVISMDKNLNLSPKGKKSAAQFAAEKKPANAKQKCVVAVYYLRDIVGLTAISVSSIYTFFKALGWPLPANLKNMLSQAGTDGWLDTSNFEEIQLTTIGENLVEHSLPPKEKT
jgi:hypothetical protein